MFFLKYIFVALATFEYSWSLDSNTTRDVIERVKDLETRVDKLEHGETEKNQQIEPITDELKNKFEENRQKALKRNDQATKSSLIEGTTKNQDTVDPLNFTITPIVPSFQKKRRKIHKTTQNMIKFRAEEIEDLIEEQSKPAKWSVASQLVYRRGKEGPWLQKIRKEQSVYCQEVFTPLLKGYDFKKHPFQYVGHKDFMLQRLVTIIHLNVSYFNYEDKMSILMQISEMRLRLFLWSVNAIKVMMNTLIVGNKHNFNTLRMGVKDLFKRWNINYSNTAILLKHTQIFRPPCMGVREPGSTKHQSQHTLYTKRYRTTKSCKSTNIMDLARTGKKKKAQNQKDDKMDDLFKSLETDIMLKARKSNANISNVNITDVP